MRTSRFMRTTKQKLASERNWELLQVKGMRGNVGKFAYKYEDFPSIFAILKHELENLEFVIKAHYHRLGVGKPKKGGK